MTPRDVTPPHGIAPIQRLSWYMFLTPKWHGKKVEKSLLFRGFPVPGCVATGLPQCCGYARAYMLSGFSDVNIQNTRVKDGRRRSRLQRASHKGLGRHPKAQIPARSWYPATVLQCKTITLADVPQGFVLSTSSAKLAEGAAPPVPVSHPPEAKRSVAYRVPFFGHACFDDERYTVSHLCHNNECFNWEHHVLESLAVNKSRNGCPGGDHCHHQVRCIMPGPYSES